MAEATKSHAAEIEAKELGQIAYEARFDGLTLGPRGVSDAWCDLPPMAKAIWARVEERVLAALQGRAFEDGAQPHVAEALKREAQEQAFRRDLAERSYASLKERLLKAAHMALAGNDRALRRLVNTIENPVPIQGSAVLQPEGERSNA